MVLKRTGNYSKAALYALLALAVVAAEITIGVRLAASGSWTGLTFLLPFVGVAGACLALPLTLLAIAVPIVLLWHERKLRAATAEGARRLPLASTQPDRSLALRDGETVVLMRRRLRIGTLRDVLTTLQFLTLLPVISPVLLLVLPFGVNPLDIGFLADLVLLCAILVADGIWMLSIIRSRWLRITSDDRGIAVERPLSARHFIPWNDILLFLRTNDNKSGAVEGTYLLWGRDHFTELEIGGPSTSVEGKEKAGSRENVYRYEGGYEAYAANAGRLLATIVARGYVGLQVLADTPMWRTNPNRRASIMDLGLERALVAPIAPPALQLSPEAVDAARSATGRLKLASRLATPSFFAQTIVWFLGLLAVFVLIGMFLHLPYFSLALLLSGDPFALLFFGLLIPMLLAAAFEFAWMRRRRKLPAVTADDNRLAVVRSQTIRIRWRDIRAWAIVPGASGRPTAYVVFSSDQVARWVEPADAELGGSDVRGDRRVAFRERAQALHALIAARTGLPLRELSLDDDGRAANGSPKGMA